MMGAMREPAQAALLALLSDGHAPAAPLDPAGWDAVAREAGRHGVAPLLHARLAAAGALPVPPAVRQALQATYMRTGLDNLRRLTRLATVLRAAQAHRIDMLVLKGAHLASGVYGDPAVRPMADVDLLVRRADLERASALLQAGGWRAGARTPRTSPAGGGHQLPTFALGLDHLELHWSIEDDDSPFAIDGDGLWERALPIAVGGVPALALAPEDLLLHLALHTAYGHGWRQFDSGLRPLCDIQACLRCFAGRLDWDALVARARAWRAHPSAWLTFAVLDELLHARVPPPVLAALGTPGADRALVEAAAGLVLGHHYRALDDHLPVLARSWLARRSHRLPRAARWRAHAWPGAAALDTTYPSLRAGALAPLRYAAHWADLLADVARLSFGRQGRRLLRQEQERLRVMRWLEAP